MKRSRLMLMILVGALLLLGLSQLGGDAATATSSPIVSASASAMISITLSPTNVAFGALTSTDYDTGYKELTGGDAQTVTIKSNTSWSLTIQADAATFTYSGTYTDPSKPCSDLEIEATTSDSHITIDPGVSSTYAALSSTAATNIATGDAGGSRQLTTSFKLLLNWASDVPGDYTLNVTYTATNT